MPKFEKEITILNEQGLHARPAALFVQIASKFNAQVTVRKGSEKVNGKSIMGILILAAQHKSVIVVETEGEDAEAAMKELEGFLSKNE